MKSILALILLFFLPTIPQAQFSLTKQWAKANEMSNDTAKLIAYRDILTNMRNQNMRAAENYFPQILALSERLAIDTLHYPIVNGIGVLYYYSAQYPKAMRYFTIALKNAQKRNDKANELRSQYNIAFIYYATQNFDKMLKTLQYLIVEYEKQGNLKQMVNLHNDIGSVYKEQKRYILAEREYRKALEIATKLGTPSLQIAPLHNLGLIFQSRMLYKKALNYFFEALSLETKEGNKEGLAESYNSIGKLYVEMNDFEPAQMYLHKGLALANEIGVPVIVAEALENLTDLEEKRGNFEQALRFHKRFKALEDSVLSIEKSKEISELQTQYDTESKDRENEILKKDNLLKENRIWYLKLGGTAVSVALLMMLFLAIALYRSIKHQRRTNTLLQQQNIMIGEQNAEIQAQADQLMEANQFINQQKEHLEYQHSQTQQSIAYASRIQVAIIPTLDSLSDNYPDNFVLWYPRDVVSGDFYWIRKNGHKILLTVADCTGHGVPGALVSMLGVSLLNEIVTRGDISQANQVLEQMRIHIKTTFNQMGEASEQKDGMDMSFVTIDTETRHLQFAGANNSIYIVRNGELIILEATRNPIGVYVREIPFQNHHFQLQTHDCVYLFSDGYADQIGGPKNKRMLRRTMQEQILRVATKPMKEQKQELAQFFAQWRGNVEQLDDVLVLGFRIE